MKIEASSQKPKAWVFMLKRPNDQNSSWKQQYSTHSKSGYIGRQKQLTWKEMDKGDDKVETGNSRD